MIPRGRLLLQAQRDRGEPLGPPPDWLSAEEVRAWHDIVAAVPGNVWRQLYAPVLAHVSRALASWRKNDVSGFQWARLLYRWFGQFLMPMAARRRLLFPNSKPSRSRRV